MKYINIIAVFLASFQISAMEVEVNVLFKKEKKSFPVHDCLNLQEHKTVTMLDCAAGLVEMTLTSKTENNANLEFKIFEKTDRGIVPFSSDRTINILVGREKMRHEEGLKAWNDMIVKMIRIEAAILK